MSELREPPFGPGPLKGMRVLVAEDDAWTADRIGLILVEEGARLLGPCSTVAEARCLLDQQHVEFVLVDLNLSDSFADDLVEDSRRRNIPFAIITGYEALPTNAYDGAEGVFLKPVQRRGLIEMLARFL
jgi:DNA-binding NtrC family response regulator